MRIEDNTRSALAPAAAFCRAAEQALRTGEAPRVEPAAIAAPGAARPLADAISRTLRLIAEILASPSAAAPAKGGDQARSARRLLAADAFSNPEHVRFAVKLTTAVMTCYFIESLADWPAIGTCAPTCFVVALALVGELLHKATLRIVGALLGGGLGLGAILLLMPRMTDLGDLFLLLTPVTLLAAWIACGTERIAYAGMQIGLAFYLVVLHGTGPTIDLDPARDRVIGVLLGNVVIFVVFTTIWPVSVASVVRANVAKALGQLANIRRLGRRRRRDFASRPVRGRHRVRASDRAGARGSGQRSVRDKPGEARCGTAADRCNHCIAGRSPLHPSRDDPRSHRPPGWSRHPEVNAGDVILAHHRALAAWLRRAASWVHNGEGAAEVADSLPDPPSRPAWVMAPRLWRRGTAF